jgi:hypothetical protein
MKIFVIGPEGAGKTVFLAMLSHHLAKVSSEVVFEPMDYESTQYVASALDLLECQKWPKSNPQGELRVLRWRFGRKAKSPHQINLFDYSGQDMRSVLLEDDPEKLQGRSRELRMEIDDSDMLVYLLDMDGFIGSGVLMETNENAWLLHTFLTRPTWSGKRRILVVTKADVYAGMISEAGGDIKSMISHHWPKVYNVNEFLSQQEKIKCFALTSVMVTTELDTDGRPVRKPQLPLQSEGFDDLVEGILSGIEKDRPKIVIKETGKILGNVMAALGRLLTFSRKNKGASLFVILVLGYLARFVLTDPYEFTFVTGDRDGAGTNSYVELSLRDQRGKETSVSFGGWYRPWQMSAFEMGKTDTFSRRLRRLESMKELTVEISGSGHKPAWFLVGIQVENLTTGEKAVFSCNSWLGKDEANPGDDPWALRLTAL